MKNLKTIFATTLFAAVIGLGATASAQATRPGFVTVVRVEGIASYSLGDDNWRPLLAGKTLPPGSIIRTGDNGVVDAVLGKSIDFPSPQKAPDRISPAADAAVRGYVSCKPSAQQNVIRMTPETMLAIDKLNVTDTDSDSVGDTELDLKKGRIFASVKKLNATSQYLVKYPTGIAGVRGTEFSLSAGGSTVVFSSSNGGLVISGAINGVAFTQLVAVGQVLDGLTGNISAAPPSLQAVLSTIFASLTTTYSETVTVTVNFNNNTVTALVGAGSTQSTPPQTPP